MCIPLQPLAGLYCVSISPSLARIAYMWENEQYVRMQRENLASTGYARRNE